MKTKTENNGTRWITKTEFYDVEDGTELTPKYAKQNYIIIAKNIITKFENGYGIRTIINQCQRDKQLKLL